MKKILTYTLIVSLLGFIIYRMLKPTDEIGFLGAGKIGRQVLIQNLDQIMKKHASVTSDFFDNPSIVRFIFGEPLRTTIRFDFQDEEANTTTLEMLKANLNQPHETMSPFLGKKIILQEEHELDSAGFQNLLKEKNVESIEDLYAGFGFKKYEMYIKGKPKFSIEIQNVKNTQHLGE